MYRWNSSLAPVDEGAAPPQRAPRPEMDGVVSDSVECQKWGLSTVISTISPIGEEAPVEPINVVVRRPLQDRIFRTVVRAAGGVTLVAMGLIFAFLVIKSYKSLRLDGLARFLTTQQFIPQAGRFGIGSVLFNTVIVALVASVLAFPMSIGTALYLTHYCPTSLRRLLTSLLDLMAAIPSVVFGLWGLYFLTPRQRKLSIWLTHHLGFIPIFKTSPNDHSYAGSAFLAGTVLALMIIPISAAIMREAFSQAPPGEQEGALALGATRWGMIRTVVIPFGRGGIIGGSMLALGRALGETIAVLLLITTVFNRSTRILDSGTNTVAALIANQFGEATPLTISALMAAGLALFVLTLIVNTLASIIVSRSRSGAATEI
jgi:phosphate transport system permease protein